MKTTITLLALISLAFVNAVQAGAVQTKKPVTTQQTAAKVANVKVNSQATVQPGSSAEQAQGQLQCKTKAGKPVHCN